MPENESSGILEARETFHILMEMSRLLNTGLDPDTLMCCVRLIEAGINPEALSVVIRELRREASTLTEQKPSDKDNKKD